MYQLLNRAQQSNANSLSCWLAGRHRVISILLALICSLGAMAAQATEPEAGDFRVANYSSGFTIQNHWWRGYAFKVSSELQVSHMWGGSGPNCASGGFQGGIFRANWPSGTVGEGNPRLDELLAGVEFDPSRDPGDPPQEELVALDSPITLVPGESYFIGQGSVVFSPGCHYSAETIDVENLLIGAAVIDQWYPDEDAAFQFNQGNATAENIVGRTASTLTPIRVLVGFRYDTDVTLATVTTGDALPLDPETALVDGELVDSGVLDAGDVTTLYFEFGQDPNLVDGTLVPALPFNISGPQQNLPISTELTGLSEGTTYYYRAVAINAGGRANGEILSFVQEPPYNLLVSATAGENGFVTPDFRAVPPGETTSFSVVPDAGFVRVDSVGGDCPSGSWSNNSYTTGPVSTSCEVEFSFQAAEPVPEFEALPVPLLRPWGLIALIALLLGLSFVFLPRN